MGRVVALTLLAFAVAPLHATPQRTRPVAKKSPSVVTAHKSSSGNRPVAASRAGAHASSASLHVASTSRSTRASVSRSVRGRNGKIVHVVHAPPAPTYQLHPDPDRYQQIQKALADRGYFKGEPNGEWGDDSNDAMRRFQADQKIDNDGKIDSLSLIALGLGPRHDGTTASEPRVPEVPASVSSPSPQAVSPAAPAAVTNGLPR